MSHREFVGGLWDSIGQLQFDFMLAEGLRPEHYLLDVACGALRAGVHFIPYLDTGHYWGLEKRQELVCAGLTYELSPDVCMTKRPRFVINADFDLTPVPSGISFDYILAASLFTHLLPEDIERCVKALLPRLAEGGRFYATYLPLGYPGWPQEEIDDHELNIAYLDLEWFGKMTERLGVTICELHEYAHPRGQRMLHVERKA